MTAKEILKNIQHVIYEFIDPDAVITTETDILGELQLDSLKMLTLVVELENHFQVAFAEGDEQELETIEDLVHLIEKSLTI